jgi:alpha-glucosidase
VHEHRPAGTPAPDATWWRGAAIYQLYVRSFADGDGDGVGDLAGVRAHLPYLAELGIDAIWFSPWYPSPMSDAGYDISDYRDIEPAFGALADADTLIGEAHAHGIRIIIDIVPNHCSDKHPWFAEALAASAGSAARDRFWFRPGRGAAGELPPNDWQSIFGGPAWTRITEPDGSPGEWYLHLFAPEQPDFNWGSAAVRREFEDVLRFWFDRGVDGIRIDSAALLSKDPRLPEMAPDEPPGPAHPYSDRDDVHEIYRSWRALADEYAGRVLIGEIWIPDAVRLARYVGPGELHTVFNFPYLSCPWDGPGCAPSSTTPWSCTRWRTHRRRGCCRTMTWTGSCPGTAGRTPRSACSGGRTFTASPSTSNSAPAGPGQPRC